MKALAYNGPGTREWKEVPDPVLQDPEDAIVRVDAVTICGTDLHILKGDVTTVERGRIVGHEAVGAVQALGSSEPGRSAWRQSRHASCEARPVTSSNV